MLTLVQVKSTFNALVSRDEILTDEFVDKIARVVQNSILSEAYFSFTLDTSLKSIMTTDGVEEYDLSVLNPSWNIRKVRTIRKIDSADNRRGKLLELSFREVRTSFPDPETSPGRGIPSAYYIKNNGTKIGLIKIPDAIYEIFIDFYTYAEDPFISGNFLIPSQFELVIVQKLAELWYESKDQTDKANSRHVKYNIALSTMKKDDKEVSRDVRKQITKYQTNSLRGVRDNRFFTDKQIDDALYP